MPNHYVGDLLHTIPDVRAAHWCAFVLGNLMGNRQNLTV